jgi:hypothetical protein
MFKSLVEDPKVILPHLAGVALRQGVWGKWCKILHSCNFLALKICYCKLGKKAFDTHSKRCVKCPPCDINGKLNINAVSFVVYFLYEDQCFYMLKDLFIFIFMFSNIVVVSGNHLYL